MSEPNDQAPGLRPSFRKILTVPPIETKVLTDEEILQALASPQPVSEYYRLATIVIGQELEEAPLLPPSNVTDPPHRNIGDLTDRDDQRLAARCGIDPEPWAALNEEQRIGRMMEVIAALPGGLVTPTAPATGEQRVKPAVPLGETLDEQAVAIFVSRKGRVTKKEIARILVETGVRTTCHEKSLTPKRCPKLHQATQAYRAANNPPRGSKDAEGNLEAWEDE